MQSRSPSRTARLSAVRNVVRRCCVADADCGPPLVFVVAAIWAKDRAEELGVGVGQPATAKVGDEEVVHVAGVVEAGGGPDFRE